MDAGTSRLLTSFFMVLVGIGLGLTMQMATTIAQNSVEMRDMGAAMSTSTLFRTVGGSLAIAAFGSLFTRTAGGVGTAAGVATAGSHIFGIAAVRCALAVPVALAIREVPLRAAGPVPTSGVRPAPAVMSK